MDRNAGRGRDSHAGTCPLANNVVSEGWTDHVEIIDNVMVALVVGFGFGEVVGSRVGAFQPSSVRIDELSALGAVQPEVLQSGGRGPGAVGRQLVWA